MLCYQALILASRLQNSTNRLCTSELVQAAIGDRKKQVTVPELSHLQIEDCSCLWQLKNHLKLLQHLKLSFIVEIEGTVINRAGLRAKHDLKHIICIWIMINVDCRNALGPVASEELLSCVIRYRIVDRVDLILVPRGTENIMVLQKQTMHTLEINTDLLDVVWIQEMAINVLWLARLIGHQVVPSDNALAIDNGPELAGLDINMPVLGFKNLMLIYEPVRVEVESLL